MLKFLPLLICAMLWWGCTGNTENTQDNTTSVDAVSAPQTPTPKNDSSHIDSTSAGTLPAAGCNFSMHQIKYRGDGEFVAVTGLRTCVNKEPQIQQEVSLYKKGEPINTKLPNVYTTDDTAGHITIGWSGDTLMVWHFTDEPQQQEYKTVEGVITSLNVGQKGT